MTANSDGEFYGKFKNNGINLFGKHGIFGMMGSISMLIEENH